MNKIIRNGQVAVLISPDYGAGWSTWNHEYPAEELMFDPGLVLLVEEGNTEKIETYATLKWPNAYLGGLRNICVEWVNQGTAFRINEYDGAESIELMNNINWQIA